MDHAGASAPSSGVERRLQHGAVHNHLRVEARGGQALAQSRVLIGRQVVVHQRPEDAAFQLLGLHLRLHAHDRVQPAQARRKRICKCLERIRLGAFDKDDQLIELAEVGEAKVLKLSNTGAPVGSMLRTSKSKRKGDERAAPTATSHPATREGWRGAGAR